MGLGMGALACGGSVEPIDPDAQGSVAGGGNGGGNAGGQGSGATAGAPGGTGGEPSTLGVPCDASEDCGADEYCHPLGYGCDQGWAECRKRPEACEEIYDPVCACDGVIYANACEANAAGQGYALYSNSCEPPAGQFKCGYGFCDLASAYCEEIFESSFTCKPLPASCAAGPADCATCFGGADGLELPPGCYDCYDLGPDLTVACGVF